MKIGSSKGINKDHKKLTPREPGKAEGVTHTTPNIHLMKSMDKPVKDYLVVQNNNPKTSAEKHNHDKLAITFMIMGTGLIAYQFW